MVLKIDIILYKLLAAQTLYLLQMEEINGFIILIQLSFL